MSTKDRACWEEFTRAMRYVAEQEWPSTTWQEPLSDGTLVWLAKCSHFEGAMMQGVTEVRALVELEFVRADFVIMAWERGIENP